MINNSYNNNSVDSSSDYALFSFSDILSAKLNIHYNNFYSDIIILCVGTDRSTGDSLGPLIGYKLDETFKNNSSVHIFGTLNSPVHAKNLDSTIEYINSNFLNPFIIAIDASLGKLERVGYINVYEGPLKPGAGVNKYLPEVGNIHITGIVNMSGFMEYVVLQNTRLNLVMKMADVISVALNSCINKLLSDIKSTYTIN